MSDAIDPLEAELSALKPRDVSPGLLQRVAEQLNERPRARFRLRGKSAVIGGLAAACVAAAILWWTSGRQVAPDPVVGPGTGHGDETTIASRGSDESDKIVAWRDVWRILDGAEMSTFAWPLDDASPFTGSSSIPPDPFD
jgi:hypothetical protein